MSRVLKLHDKIPSWKYTNAFDDKEKLVLQWAAAITRMEGDFEELKTQMQTSFSEKKLVDLTASIYLMNAMNRLRITLGDIH